MNFIWNCRVEFFNFFFWYTRTLFQRERRWILLLYWMCQHCHFWKRFSSATVLFQRQTQCKLRQFRNRYRRDLCIWDSVSERVSSKKFKKHNIAQQLRLARKLVYISAVYDNALIDFQDDHILYRFWFRIKLVQVWLSEKVGCRRE